MAEVGWQPSGVVGESRPRTTMGVVGVASVASTLVDGQCLEQCSEETVELS